MRMQVVSHKQRLLHMQSHNVHLKRVSRYVFAKWTYIMYDAFHLHWALGDSRRLYVQRRHWRQSGFSKFVALVPVSPAHFFLGHRILAGCERQPVHVSHADLGMRMLFT